MTFDPLADIIDLHDVIKAINDDDASEAFDFACALCSDLGYSDPDIGENLRAMADDEPTVIARRYFVEYAQDLAYDVGAIDNKTYSWPLNCIDWERAARELEYDYSTFTYDGREYLIRSV